MNGCFALRRSKVFVFRDICQLFLAMMFHQQILKPYESKVIMAASPTQDDYSPTGGEAEGDLLTLRCSSAVNSVPHSPSSSHCALTLDPSNAPSPPVSRSPSKLELRAVKPSERQHLARYNSWEGLDGEAPDRSRADASYIANPGGVTAK